MRWVEKKALSIIIWLMFPLSVINHQAGAGSCWDEVKDLIEL